MFGADRDRAIKPRIERNKILITRILDSCWNDWYMRHERYATLWFWHEVSTNEATNGQNDDNVAYTFRRTISDERDNVH